MKKAILILAHENELFLSNLVFSLQHSDFDIYIHIDLKKDIDKFKNIDSKLSNLYFIDERENGNWGDIGLVKATLNLLKIASKKKYSHYMLISGSDLPIKSMGEISTFLDENTERSFIEYHKFPYPEINYQGFDRVYGTSFNLKGKRYTFVPYSLKPKFNFKGKILNLILGAFCLFRRRKKPEFIEEFYYGSQWWTLSSKSVDYILSFVEKHPDYLYYHEKTLIPDEIFFQSILMNNSQISELISNDNLRLIVWGANSHPDYLDEKPDDFFKKSTKHFARKFKTFRAIH